MSDHEDSSEKLDFLERSDADDSPDESTSDSDDDSDSDDETESLQKYLELLDEITKNKYSYDSYVQLIEIAQ